MTGLDGINSLQKLLGGLQVKEPTTVGGASAAVGAAAAKTARPGQVAGGHNVDHTSLSAAGGLAAQATDTSDVRQTKVAELRQAIAAGSYNVPASAVASKMVDSLLK
jgi:flagellar biosynthesis anti-sigma factor FlgM